MLLCGSPARPGGAAAGRDWLADCLYHIYGDGGGWQVSLTGYSSVNPTTVNGRALRPVEDEEGGMSSIGATAVLRDGDSFTIADRPFRFEYNAGTTRQDLAAQRRWGRPPGWLAG